MSNTQANKDAVEALNELDSYALARMDNKRGVWKDLVQTIRKELEAAQKIREKANIVIGYYNFDAIKCNIKTHSAFGDLALALEESK